MVEHLQITCPEKNERQEGKINLFHWVSGNGEKFL
jgi:hypothetical protein